MNHTGKNGRQNGGCVAPFPSALLDAFDDLAAVRAEIEHAEAQSARWTAKRDQLEAQLDQRLIVGRQSTQSHAEAISGHMEPMCRLYQRRDPSVAELAALAAKAKATRVEARVAG